MSRNEKLFFLFFKFSQKLSWADNVWKGPKTPPIILIDSNNCNWLNCIFSFCNAQIQTNSRLQSATENCLFLTLQAERTHCHISDETLNFSKILKMKQLVNMIIKSFGDIISFKINQYHTKLAIGYYFVDIFGEVFCLKTENRGQLF